MAHYFKFHSTQDVASESVHLGLDLRFSEDLTPLFRPVSIGPLRAGNALCIQPMEGCDGTLAGEPDELTFRRYQRFGAGGAKLIWGEAAAVLDEGRANSRQLLVSETTLPALERMRVVCQQAHQEAFGSADDLVIGLQLTHSGRYSYRMPLLACHDPVLDPRTIQGRAYRMLDDDELERLPDLYVRAAKLVARAGYQFVDVKQCHRYLLSELLAARTRPGKFGGSLENRTRVARTVFQALRAEVPDLVLATRINIHDGLPYQVGMTPDGAGKPCAWQAPLACTWGTSSDDPFTADLSEPLAWIAEMRQLGVSLVNISMGNPYASPHLIRPFEYPPPDGYHTPEHPLIGVDRHFRLAAAVQQAFPDLPVVGSGYSYLQEFFPQAGAANIRDGRITLVGVGRASLSQPDFARQLLEKGRLDRKRVCRTFSYCTALMRSKHNEQGQFATGCPPFDKDVYMPLWDLARKQA